LANFNRFNAEGVWLISALLTPEALANFSPFNAEGVG
jgi:hypothetical protein